MSKTNQEQFQNAGQQPSTTAYFSPLQPGEPVSYDPSGWENTMKNPAWTKNARILGRRRHSDRFGDSYVRNNVRRDGWVRTDLNSTMED